MAKFPCLPPSKQDLLPSCPSGCSGTCGSSLPSSSDASPPSSSPSGCGAAGAQVNCCASCLSTFFTLDAPDMRACPLARSSVSSLVSTGVTAPELGCKL
eukprot:1471681-Amphidinium_carterae.1